MIAVSLAMDSDLSILQRTPLYDLRFPIHVDPRRIHFASRPMTSIWGVDLYYIDKIISNSSPFGDVV